MVYALQGPYGVSSRSYRLLKSLIGPLGGTDQGLYLQHLGLGLKAKLWDVVQECSLEDTGHIGCKALEPSMKTAFSQ